jgi:hypothetical protein
MQETQQDLLKAIVESNCELALFRYIDSLSGLQFRLAHSTKLNRTEAVVKELDNLQSMLKEAVIHTTKYVSSPLHINDVPTKDYWKWYDKWKTFVDRMDTVDYEQLCQYEEVRDFESMKKMYEN